MRVLFVFGTRPEAIKLAPMIRTLRASDNFDVKVCVTAQHRQMLDSVLSFFEIVPDYDLDLMKANQTLFDITSRCLDGLRTVFADCKPDHLVVQGDTSTTFAGALAAYYCRVPVSHLEAGLRSGDKLAPYPEEVNRVLTGHIADLHFAPTERARANLAAEGISERVWVVGNTVIDALLTGLELLRGDTAPDYQARFEGLDLERPILLITGHRRESFGGGFRDIAQAIRRIAQSHPQLQLIYPVHLNPNVQQPVHEILDGRSNVSLIEPIDYPEMIWLMEKCRLVLTDSGGIQEEAPALGKPVLVMRDVTERQEGVEAGTAELVGTDQERIVASVNRLLTDEQAYQQMAKAVNPYGDGTTSAQVRDILLEHA